MGRKASHVALECALQSHPNMVGHPILLMRISFFYKLQKHALSIYIFGIYWDQVTWLNSQVILGEEVAASKLTIFDLTKQICDAVQARADKG